MRTGAFVVFTAQLGDRFRIPEWLRFAQTTPGGDLGIHLILPDSYLIESLMDKPDGQKRPLRLY